MGCFHSRVVEVKDRWVHQWNESYGWQLSQISIRDHEPGFHEDIRVLEVWQGTSEGHPVSIDVTDFVFSSPSPKNMWEAMANRHTRQVDKSYIPILSLRDKHGTVIGVVYTTPLSCDYWQLERITAIGASHNLTVYRHHRPSESSNAPMIERPQSYADYRINHERFNSQRSQVLSLLYSTVFCKQWPLVVWHSREIRYTPEWAR